MAAAAAALLLDPPIDVQPTELGRLAPVPRRPALWMLIAAALTLALSGPAGAGPSQDTVGLGSLDPGSGPPGTIISYTVVGSPNADSECRGSSAFATELLDATGARIGTGANTVVVPDGATPGQAFVHLICYVADATGRRVIYGVCSGFEITDAATPPGAAKTATGATVNEPCPATPRMVVSQSVINTQTTLGLTFNEVLANLG